MSDVLDGIKREIAQLAQTVKEHRDTGDMGTLDRKALAEAVKGLVDEQIKAQWQAAERDRPHRRGELIGPPGLSGPQIIPDYGVVPGFGVPSKGLVQDGRFAGYSADDVIFVNWLLRKW